MTLGYLAAIGSPQPPISDAAGLIVPGTTAEIALALAGAGYAYWRWRSLLLSLGVGWALAKFTFPATFGLLAEAFVKFSPKEYGGRGGLRSGA